MGNFVDTVEVRIRNAILTTTDNIITPRIELSLWSINASSGRETTSITANSESEERVRITTSFENVSERNNTDHVLNTKDETRRKIPDEVKCRSQENILTGNHTFITAPVGLSQLISLSYPKEFFLLNATS